MVRVEWAEPALADLQEIHEFIARDEEAPGVLDLRFDSGNATAIFKMTSRPNDDLPHDDAVHFVGMSPVPGQIVAAGSGPNDVVTNRVVDGKIDA